MHSMMDKVFSVHSLHICVARQRRKELHARGINTRLQRPASWQTGWGLKLQSKKTSTPFLLVGDRPRDKYITVARSFSHFSAEICLLLNFIPLLPVTPYCTAPSNSSQPWCLYPSDIHRFISQPTHLSSFSQTVHMQLFQCSLISQAFGPLATFFSPKHSPMRQSPSCHGRRQTRMQYSCCAYRKRIS